MDKLEKFRKIIQKVLLPYCDIKYANGDFQNKPVFDRENDSYLIVSQGWEKNQQFSVWNYSSLIWYK